MERFGNKNNIAAIQEEYRRVDSKWLKMQYQLIIYLVLFVTAVELVMFFVLQSLGMVFTSNEKYLLKYLAVPFMGNFTLMMIAAKTLQSKKMSEKRKIYIITAVMSVMAYWIYNIHMVFPVVAMVFLIPMLLTVVYADQRLTAMTAALCVLGKAGADLFPFWVPERRIALQQAAEKVDFGLSLAILLIFYGICAFMILVEKEKTDAAIRLEQERQRYQAEAITDQLTRVWNRQALRQMFQRMTEDETEERYFLAMMDLDDFKYLNDTYGHSQGDRHLKALGQVLLELSDEQVTPFRFGGDEFCVVFRGCEPERVEAVCRTIQARYAEVEVEQEHQTVSVSIGVAEYQKKEAPTQLLDRADKALYHAKQQARKGGICFEKD